MHKHIGYSRPSYSTTLWRLIGIFEFWTAKSRYSRVSELIRASSLEGWGKNVNGPAGIIGYILTWFDYKLDFTWLFSCFVIGCNINNVLSTLREPLIERKPLFYDVKILSSVIFHENIVNIESKHNYESKVIETKQKIYLPNKYYRIRSTHNPIYRWNLHALERPQAVQKMISPKILSKTSWYCWTRFKLGCHFSSTIL